MHQLSRFRYPPKQFTNLSLPTTLTLTLDSSTRQEMQLFSYYTNQSLFFFECFNALFPLT